MDHRWFDDLGTMEVLGENPASATLNGLRGDSKCSTDVILRYVHRRVRKIEKKKQLFASSHLPASPHGTTRLPLTDFHMTIFRKSVQKM